MNANDKQPSLKEREKPQRALPESGGILRGDALQPLVAGVGPPVPTSASAAAASS